MKKTYIRDIHIYVTQEEWKYLHERAMDTEVSLTEYIRELIRQNRSHIDKPMIVISKGEKFEVK